MALEGSEVVKQYVETLRQGFHCHKWEEVQYEEVQYIVINTPYLYPNDDGICLYVEELPGGQVRVSDGGEAAHLNLWKEGFDIFRSPRAMALAREIARDNLAEFDLGDLTKTGPAEELGDIMLNVIQAAHGVAHLQYVHPRHRPTFPGLKKQGNAAFPEKLKTFLAEIGLEYAAAPRLTGGSGQVYTAHYKVAGFTYLHTLNPGRSSRAKPLVDRIFGMWADCNDNLEPGQKITLLNDEAFPWKEAHVKRLSQVSTVINWSDRDKLVDLLASRA